MISEQNPSEDSKLKILRIDLQYWELADFNGNTLQSETYATPSCNHESSRLNLLRKSLIQANINKPVILVIDGFTALNKVIDGYPQELRDINRKRDIILRVIKSIQATEPLVWEALPYDHEHLLFAAFKESFIKKLVNTLESADIYIEKVWSGFLIDYMRARGMLDDASFMVLSNNRGVIFHPKHSHHAFKNFTFNSPEDLARVLQELPEDDKKYPIRIHAINQKSIEANLSKILPIQEFISHLPYSEWDATLLPNRRWIHIIRFLRKAFRMVNGYEWILALMIGGYFLGSSIANFKQLQTVRTEIARIEHKLDTCLPHWQNFRENPKIFETLIRQDNLLKVWEKIDNVFTKLSGVFVKKIGLTKIEENLQLNILQLNILEADWIQGPPLEAHNLDLAKSKWSRSKSTLGLLSISLGQYSWKIVKTNPESQGGNL